MPDWTREQQAAIDARNHTILVGAAAGSGKTAVLIERIVQLVREGFSLERMLIVTFTRAAAAEMRERLNKRLTKEAQAVPDRMGRALDELEGADISTIHSFCQKVVRNDFQALGVDPLCRICEEQQKQQLFEEAFCEAMNELLEEHQPDFDAFAEAFEQQEIREITGRLYTFLMSLPQPFRWLEEKIEGVPESDFEQHAWYRRLVSHAALQLNGLGERLDAMRAMFDDPHAVPELLVTWEKDVHAVEHLMDADGQDAQALLAALNGCSFDRAASARGLDDEQKAWKKLYTKARDDMKGMIRDTRDALSLDREKLALEFGVMKRHLRGLSLLIRRTDKHFAEAKVRQNVLDFSDLEQMTLRVLSDESCRARLQAEYDHIFVDECQDVSAVQDAIVEQLHGESCCLFMVGDVKQSIYRFRLADPTLFLHRMRTFSDAEDARERRIFLQRNFRSRAAVLEATNRVFRRCMKAEVTELDYLPQDELIPGRQTVDDPAVEVHLADVSEDAQLTELEAESLMLVDRIRFLLTQPTEAGDRTYQYRDLVILLPQVSRVGSALAELLQEQGVPVYFDGAESYFGLPEIMQMRALLSVIGNPLQDVPLLSALKLPPFSMTEQELADVRLCLTGRDVPFHAAFAACCEGDGPLAERCRAVREVLADWRFLCETMPLKDFLWHVLRESGFYASCGALPEGELRQANLRLLCQRAAEYENIGGVTLQGFLELLDNQQQAGDSRSAKVLGESENLVRIMTIHKSKGLEFPVVFCLRLSGKLHKPGKSPLMTHSVLGVALPYVNRTLNIRRQTLANEAFHVQRLLDEKAERARLLYVAMTRARERLLLMGCAPAQGCSTWNIRPGAYRIWSADSMLDWVMQAVRDDESTGYPQAANPWRTRVWSHFTKADVDKNKVIHSLAKWLHSVSSVPAVDKLGIPWQETQQTASQPLKTSVSSLTRKTLRLDPLPLTDADESAEGKRVAEEIVSPLRLSELPARPAFLQEPGFTGAERGSAVHAALSLLDLEEIRRDDGSDDAIWQGLARLEERGCISAEEADVISVRSIRGFFRSELGRRMLASPEVHREWSFNLLLEGTQTLLQGVIDCAFREGDGWILLDYKTDRVVDEEAFVQRYQPQLNWYATALERITGRPVTEMWLYALGRSRAFPVPRT